MLRKLCRIGGTALFVALIVFGRNLAGYLAVDSPEQPPAAIAVEDRPDPLAIVNATP